MSQQYDVDLLGALPLSMDIREGVDAGKPTVVYCAGGFRSMIAASRLRAAGFADVRDLVGGYGAWDEANLGQEQGATA